MDFGLIFGLVAIVPPGFTGNAFAQAANDEPSQRMERFE
jgi:hypothetical protein